MKSSTQIQALTLIVFNLLAITIGKGQDNIDRQKYLNFTVSYALADSKEKDRTDLYDIIIRADRKSISDVQRIYIRIIDPTTGENIFVRAIDNNTLEGKATISDAAINTAEIYDKELRLNFGPFKKGTYEVFVKIKDAKRNMYFNRKKIVLGNKISTL